MSSAHRAFWFLGHSKGDGILINGNDPVIWNGNPVGVTTPWKGCREMTGYASSLEPSLDSIPSPGHTYRRIGQKRYMHWWSRPTASAHFLNGGYNPGYPQRSFYQSDDLVQSWKRWMNVSFLNRTLLKTREYFWVRSTSLLFDHIDSLCASCF